MTSSKDYLDYILDQLSGLDDISYRAMMGEYIIYYNGNKLNNVLNLSQYIIGLAMVSCSLAVLG